MFLLTSITPQSTAQANKILYKAKSKNVDVRQPSPPRLNWTNAEAEYWSFSSDSLRSSMDFQKRDFPLLVCFPKQRTSKYGVLRTPKYGKATSYAENEIFCPSHGSILCRLAILVFSLGLLVGI